MPEILLIQPPMRDFYLTGKRTVPYGLACLAASLEKAGFSVGLFDALATGKSRPIDRPEHMAYLDAFYGKPDTSPFALFHQYRHFGYSYQYIKKIVKDSGAFMVGISSLFTAYCTEALKVAALVKSVTPDTVVVLGGHHPTLLPEAVMQSGDVDFVIRGEAETSLAELARVVKEGQSPETVPGIVFRRTGEQLEVSEPVWVNDLDTCAPPAGHLIKHNYYKRGPQGAAVVMASRGCPLNCSYCAFGSGGGFPYRKRSVRSIMREIEGQVRDHAVGFIDFEDENLSMDRGWFMELMGAISRCFGDRDMELRAMNGLFPPALDDAMIQAMRAAGFKTLNLAVGTTSVEQLKRFNRVDVRAAFDAALVSARRYGLEAVGYVIAGAPDQAAETSLADLLYLAGRRVLAGVSIFYPAPGSLDYTRCQQRGLLPKRFGLMRATALPIDQKTSRLESVTLLRLGRILNFMKS
ncbi:MAG: B12-binding domain-containing radical SAM protein, partial [Desulfobacterales bacterium]|nr:B12-binding domain-containing radical SAM protein [Desulfobacterales bacterium]